MFKECLFWLLRMIASALCWLRSHALFFLGAEYLLYWLYSCIFNLRSKLMVFLKEKNFLLLPIHNFFQHYHIHVRGWRNIFLYLVTRKMFHFHYSIILNVHVNELGVERDRWFLRGWKKYANYTDVHTKESLFCYHILLQMYFFLETLTQFFIISHQKTFFKDVLSMSLQQRGTKTCGPWLQDFL